MDLSALLGSGIDPSMLAMMGGNGGQAKNFTDLLMKSISPNPAGQLEGQIGPPDLGPLNALAGNAPQIERADPAPQLPPAQTLESLGFGMAGAAGKPGSSALSALGEGGTQMLNMGGQASQRAIQETDAANRAAISEWEGKSKLAEKGLDAQLEEPSLDVKQMDLAGNMALREEAQQEQALYRAGLLGDKTQGRQIQQQNADINQQKADILAGRAGIYGEDISSKVKTRAEGDQIRQQQVDQAAQRTTENIEASLKRLKISQEGLDLRSIRDSITRQIDQKVAVGEKITPEYLQQIEDQIKTETIYGLTKGAERPPEKQSGDYGTAEDVKAAFKAKKISLDQAKALLGRFGYQ